MEDPSIEKARSQINEAEHEGHEPKGPDSISSDKSYYQRGYGNEYGRDMKSSQHVRMLAKDANIKLFSHAGSGFLKVNTEEVKKAGEGLDKPSKDILSKFAGCAWELRAENDEQNKPQPYFILREDIDVTI